MPKPVRLPDLQDMMAAGLGLTAALAFWNRMMNAPDRTTTDWWAELRRSVTPSCGASGSLLQ